MKWFWILLVAAVGLLYVTNPGMEDFEVYVVEESTRIVTEQAGTPGLGEILADRVSQWAEGYVQDVTEHKDYYLFSTYRINLTPRAVTKRTWRFLGIGGNFINLTRFYDKE